MLNWLHMEEALNTTHYVIPCAVVVLVSILPWYQYSHVLKPATTHMRVWC